MNDLVNFMALDESNRLEPPFFELDEQKKISIGYLTIKRIAITIRRFADLRNIFYMSHLKEAFHWFDKEHIWRKLVRIRSIYEKYPLVGESDKELYAFTDVLIWLINYEPDLFSQVITYKLNTLNLHEEVVKLINSTFFPAGFAYENKFFYSSSFNPEIVVKTNDLLGSKLKSINEELYTTWKSISENIISNNDDKATTISAKSRKIINGVLRSLTPTLQFAQNEQDQTKKRLLEIFKETKETEMINKISSLITTLNETQAKGDHDFVDENTAIFTFRITELVLFLILSHNKA